MVAGLSLPLSGCASLLFRQDHRISILSPTNNGTVSQPLTVTWTARDFTPGPDGEFVVFVDRSPMPPGEGLDYFAAHDQDGIFPTHRSDIQFDVLRQVTGNASAERNRHELTVILVDAHGHRIGEESGFVAFTVSGQA